MMEWKRLMLKFAAGVGEPDDLRLGGVRLQQERREVSGVERVTDVAEH